MKKTKKKPNQTRHRNIYTLDIKATAKRYYLIGLTLQEIGKIIDAPVRTIEKWQIAENWKELREITQIEIKVLDLHVSGKTYKEIATLLNKSTATVWRYLKKAKNDKATIN